ncbi:NAD(P)H-dependent oxidoreductase [Pseudoluteimonas lycopersici]|uniref:NAD(P)H-dependent oxidoreductase n=1 Tax=Pseudoluteimonas lycopersici TaxID=1324796 RepID=A0A516V542_9GAMM|nr:NADPH-dependent FMN reductase [Lysobacter lycopersici]QDQ73645.1 NAD(P)H-dependent oxidoreductase [Lysobacter lycopersici]
MTRILGISGSLRAGSFNTALLRAAQQVAGDGFELEMATLHGIPLYDGDVEATNGIPEAASALKDKIAASDGVLLVTPEYNNGVPGVFKNGIDWLSRPAGDIPRLFGGKPFALIGASPGGFGTILSQNHWLPVLKTLGVDLWAGSRLYVSRAGQAFDANGELVDDKVRAQLAEFVRGFAAFAGDKRS